MNNFKLKMIPERSAKPREKGLTMVMDKGLSYREAEDLISVSGGLIDIIKLGFGTAFVTPNLEEKIKLYQRNNIIVYFGGTLFEAFLVRNQFDEYLKVLERFKLTHAEISDGSIELPHDIKLDYISKLSQYVTVLSEVGSKDVEKIIWEAPQKAQQTYFIKLVGANVSLGNIAPNDVIPCETLRLGLRSDTFNFFLGKGAKYLVKKK